MSPCEVLYLNRYEAFYDGQVGWFYVYAGY
jgi:hypothetical protein